MPAPSAGIERARAVFDRATAALDRGIAAVVCALLGFTVLANAAEIVLRGAFSRSLPWLYETNLLLANWIYFLGMCLVYYRRKDITLDFILLVLKGSARRAFLVIVNLVGVATFLIVAWYAALLMRLQMPFRTSGNGIPNPLFSLPVALATLLMALILIKQSLDIWSTGEVAVGAHAEEAEGE